MNLRGVNKAAEAARKFLDRVASLKNKIAEKGIPRWHGYPETEVLRQESLDLTRLLAEMRGT